MPVVTTVVVIPELVPSQVWPVLSDFERYPERMSDVVSVRVLEKSPNHMVSSWEVLLNGSRFTWTERDELIQPHMIKFEQIDGDLEVWKGSWELIEKTGGLEARLQVEFDIGIPSLDEVLNPIGERAIRANSQQMLDTVRVYSVAGAR